MGFRNGDRVRICQPVGEYTGCRGTIADDPATLAQGELPLGHMVAVDGENGVRRPFLVQHLEPLEPVRVRRPAVAEPRSTARGPRGR
jgi:hypothetical protein